MTKLNSFNRRALLVGTGAVIGAGASRAIIEAKPPFGRAFPARGKSGSQTILNDASLLNPTTVAKHIVLNEEPGASFVDALRSEVKEAAVQNRSVAIGVARHSMGAQSLAKNGTAVTLEQNWLEADSKKQIFRVAAGMRWSSVIQQLDKIGFSPKVMQSNNDFGVGSTFCVNAHGWPVPWSAFCSTVSSLRLLRADGNHITCSRTENQDQFNLAMGGYGLSGIITDLDVEMVPNKSLRPTFTQLPAIEFGDKFISVLRSDPAIEMAYGRLDVTIDGFFEEALLITYRPDDDQSDVEAVEGSGFLSKAARPFFRNQLDSDRGKSLRWFIETNVGPRLGGRATTRNNLINEPVVTLDDRDPKRTDILHEYFVSPEQFPAFVKACQDIIPSSYQQLLNITLRYVDQDKESVLCYATTPRIAAVMLFSQEMSVRGEADMARMTSALIERTLEIGGSYYLPYRLHATDDQFRRAYPRATEFVQRKRESDPDLLFRNAMWDRYMANL